MQLDRSRAALRQATQSVEELRAVKDTSNLFLDKFPLVMGAVQRVGSLIDVETKGHRTPSFGNWWKTTEADPLFTFMKDVRNAEFKRGEPRQVAHHQVPLSDAGFAEDSLTVTIIEGGKVIGEVRGQPSGQQGASVARASTPSDSRSIDWYFSGGGAFDGHEVFSRLDRYIAWLRDDILPMAERLTT